MDGLLITITIPLLAGYRVPPMYNNYYHFLANKTEDPLPSLLSTISYHVALIHYLAL